MSQRIRPTVTVFSSIPSVADSLVAMCTDIPFNIIKDDALGGYGGTVDFQPSSLTTSTRLALSKAEILISEPTVVASILKYDATSLQNLKWCQSTYAGVDPLFVVSADGVGNRLLQPRPQWTLTRFAGCFGPPIAEWCLARIIEHERSFAATANDQSKKEWAGSREKVTKYRYLSSLTLSVLGCGDIGKSIAKAASVFGMKVVGYGKTPRKATDVGVDKYTVNIQEAIQAGDYIVSVLPSTAETRGILSESLLASASKANGGKSPVFLNVGRGDVVQESTLLSSLEQGHISAAILDVFETEPLTKQSPFWDHPNVIVSPHVSGLTQASDVPRVFSENYERYVNGHPLLYVVDWDKGY
ncbi:hypothetical protein ACA910_022256 [Epithemia clementina (nom. ined.)]